MNQIDLVIPVLNPTELWVEETVERFSRLQSQVKENMRLIVVDDGSEDRSKLHELKAQSTAIDVIHLERNYGKGYALRAGIAQCHADLIVFTDADFPYDLNSMLAVMNALRNGSDVVLGHRETDYYKSVPWFRKGMSELFRFVLKSILRFPITDTQCGLKGMNQEGKKVFLQTKINRFLVDMEFIKLAVRDKDVSIEPVIVRLRNNVIFSKMGAPVLARELVNFIRVLTI